MLSTPDLVDDDISIVITSDLITVDLSDCFQHQNDHNIMPATVASMLIYEDSLITNLYFVVIERFDFYRLYGLRYSVTT